MGFKNVKSVLLYCDNQSAHSLVKNPILHGRSKHIEIKYHHVIDLYEKADISLEYISTTEMVADLLTKNLHRTKHVKCTNGMSCY